MTCARACAACRRRRWLLGELSPLLDYHRSRPQRLIDLLALDDLDLIDALAGTRRARLRDEHRRFVETGRFARAGSRSPPAHDRICRHDPAFPRGLLGPGMPWMLDVEGGLGRMRSLTSEPSVAILGGRTASDYGIEMARALSRGLAASGVTVLAGAHRPIGWAALRGVLDAGRGALAVLADGLDGGRSARTGPLTLCPAGCLISEHSAGASGRRWGAPAAERILAGLADVVVLVEAREDRIDLAGADVARSLGKPLGAVPGTITSPLSGGPHAAVQGGARLIRGPEDVLEMLHDADGRAPRMRVARSIAGSSCGPRLRRVLDEIGAGADTIESLDGAPREVLACLGELEALGLVRRTRTGRYVRCDPTPVRRAGSR